MTHSFNSQVNRPNAALRAFDLLPAEPLDSDTVHRVADPLPGLVGVRMQHVVSKAACAEAAALMMSTPLQKYQGGASATLAKGLGEIGWGHRYEGDENAPANSVERWKPYFDAVDEWDEKRNRLLSPIFGIDPLDLIANIIANAVGRPVERAIHPRFGRRMGAGLVRAGAAEAHFDYARDDLGLNATGHVGVVLVFESSPSAVQRVWNQRAVPNERGNYDLNVDGVEYIDCPSSTGSLCLLTARMTHAVIDTRNRLTLAAHVARLKDGDRWVIYS